MRQIQMRASVAFDHKGTKYRPGQVFSVSAIDAVVLQNKKKARIAKPGSSKAAAKTPGPRVASTSDDSRESSRGQIQTAEMESVTGDAEEPTGRRYRRQDMRARP